MAKYNLAVELNRIQAETATWRDRNFPGFTAGDQLLGVIEEVGELSHSYLKMKQNIRGSVEEHDANGRDAVGDIMIYLMGYAQSYGLYMANCHARAVDSKKMQASTPDCAILYVSNRVGRLSHWEAVSRRDHEFEGIKRRVIGEVISALLVYCSLREWDFLECVDEAWSQVKERDWQKNKQDGSVPA